VIEGLKKIINEINHVKNIFKNFKNKILILSKYSWEI
jgi:glucan phosphorylase